jgi:adenine-specific DNA-methyltransferase
MATGVPKKRQSSDKALESGRTDALALTYANKRPVEEVLATQPSVLLPVALGNRSVNLDSCNRLYFGDNLPILAGLTRDSSLANKVRLVYIDPPFATETVFHSRKLTHAYEDILAGTEYIEFLRQRLILLRNLLAEDGSIYVHLDNKMVFHIKIVMDEIFGAENFRNCITRKKCNPKNYTRRQYGNVADYILFYTKSDNYIWNKPLEAWTKERAKEYQYVDPKTNRLFMKVPVHAPGIRKGKTGKPWRGVEPPPGKHWQFPPSSLDEMDARGDIYWSSNNNPRRKVYLDESAGVGVQDIWLDYRDAHNQNILITGYPTEKNSELLTRIVAASSGPGDLVLDCFSGSGTTLAVADGLKRRWIGIDSSEEAVRTTLKRFESGLEPMGDFVSERETASDEEPHGSLNLFSHIPNGSDVAVRPSSVHKPIRDYVLFADEKRADKVTDFIRAFGLSPYDSLKRAARAGQANQQNS